MSWMAAGQPVPLLEIADVAGVVKVGVRTDDAPQAQAIVIDEMGQTGAVQLGVAGVNEDHVLLRQKIQGQQGGSALRRPGAAQYVLHIHKCIPPAGVFHIIHRAAGKKQIFSFTPYAKPEK